MRRLSCLALAATLAASPIAAQEAAMPSDGEIAKILSDRIGRDQANIGIAVAVIENGQTRFVSHGTLSVDGTEPVTEHTPFEAGSITKVFTNLLLAQLVNEGKIDLDAPIVDYLPEGTVLPETDDRAITAFDLATHSSGLSGLPDVIAQGGIDNPYSGVGTDALFDWLASYQMPQQIGESFEYSNPGTALLGAAIAHVGGADYAELLQSWILDPLAMAETSLQLTGEPLPEGMATGHNGAREPVSNWDFDGFAPAGALISTSSDLAKFIAAASGAVETPLRPAFDTMLARTRPAGNDAIGLGWFITDTGAGEVVWHNGMTNGFRSFAGFERNSGNGVVVLSNMVTEAGIEDIGMHLLDPALPLREQPKPRTAVEIDPAILPNYVGDYVMAPGVVMSITTEENRLFAQLTGQSRFEIYPESETQFFYRIVDAQISFEVKEDGSARSLTLHQNGQNMPALKAE
jgi:D-alanyl-D-alanine-carboxypeptidase/D-alanyl-D-alanine-endopeptidase